MKGKAWTQEERIRKTRQALEEIHQLTSGDGYAGRLSTRDREWNLTVRSLKKRGVIVPRPCASGKERRWTWNTTMAPTVTLLKNVLKDKEGYRADERRRRKERQDAAGKVATAPAPDTQAPPQEAQEAEAATACGTAAGQAGPQPDTQQQPAALEPRERQAATLAHFADQELWDELKRRGYRACDGRIVRMETLD